MYPAIKPGDRLVIQKLESTDYQVGDVLVIPSDQGLIVHRAVKSLPGPQFITKGDSMASADTAPALVDDVIGKVSLLLRGRRLIAFGSGHREQCKQVYAWLSLRNLTWGVLKIKFKQLVLGLFAEKPNRVRKINQADARRWLCSLITKGNPIDPASSIDRKSMDLAALNEGVAGFLYDRLKQENGSETGTALRQYYQTITARNIAGQSIVAHLEEGLGKAHVEIMLLKGASLLGTVYPLPGLRMMEDIDIMVQPEDLHGVRALIEQHGFRAEPDRVNCYKKGQVILDLHTDALNIDRVGSRRWLFPQGMHPVWDKAIPWKKDLRQIKRPTDMDNVLLLTQHALKHGFARLIWLVDIWLILKDRSAEFWEQLYIRAEQLQQLDALYQALFLLEREFELAAPAPFNPPAGQISPLTRLLLITRQDGKKDAYTVILLPLLSIRGYAKRLTFMIETIFLQQTVARLEFSSAFTARPTFLYYLNRLGFAASQAINFARRLAGGGPFR